MPREVESYRDGPPLGPTAAISDRLYRQWLVSVLGACLLLVTGSLAIASVVDGGTGWYWAAGTAVVLGFTLGTVRYHLPRNHPPGSPGSLLPSLGRGTVLTILRGGLVATVAGFILVDPTGPFAWIPAVCYGTAIGLDWLDGWLARTDDWTTVLGERLDMALDTTGLLVASIVAVHWGPLPAWYLLVPLARYVYRGALGLRIRLELPVKPLPESRVRRPIAGGQMAFVAVALVPGIPPELVLSGAILAVIIGVGIFVRDYLAVADRL